MNELARHSKFRLPMKKLIDDLNQGVLDFSLDNINIIDPKFEDLCSIMVWSGILHAQLQGSKVSVRIFDSELVSELKAMSETP